MKQLAIDGLSPNDTKHIFLIDDDDSIRESLKTMLDFLGYHVHSYASALDFLGASMHYGPAVIITDMRMPGMSGVELQEELLRRGRSIPIIFISGQSTLPQSIQAMKQGAIEFLIKPFEREQLLTAVADGLERDAVAMRNYVLQSNLERSLNMLTPRERTVFELLALGSNNAQIQEQLQISLPTVKQYKSEVMRKLNLSSLSELIALKNHSA